MCDKFDVLGNAGKQPRQETSWENITTYTSVQILPELEQVARSFLARTAREAVNVPGLAIQREGVTIMAGSKKWFVYTTDGGDDFALLADESNTEALNAGTQDYATGVTITYALPKNIRPRAAVYASADATRTIRCYALTQAIYNGALDNQPTITDPINTANTLSLIRLEPERIKILPIPVDTGLTDGDAT